MGIFILKILIASVLIAVSSTVAKSNPRLAGFIVALPLTTMLALAFSYGEFGDAKGSVEFAKSTLYAIPLSLLFFVPFLFADKIKFGFWGIYFLGIIFLVAGYGIHRFITDGVVKG